MNDRTRMRVQAAFDEELGQAPVPPGLRALSVRAAVTAPKPRNASPTLLAFVAVVVLVALVATLVIGSHILRSTPVPAGSTTPPPPRGEAAVAFDKARGDMVLFGGTSFPAALGDTWTWDGKLWTQHHAAAGPEARYYGAMAYDDARQQVVLFGGIGVGQAALQDTWAWNGRTWRQLHTAQAPAYGYSWQAPQMAYDPISRRVIIYGFTEDYKPQMWAWNGSDWTQLSTSGFMNPGESIYDDGNRLLTVATGRQPVNGRFVFQTWSWTGSNWAVVETPFTPAIDSITSSAYDASRGELVVVNGDTWTWDGFSWSRRHPSKQPPTGYMAYVPGLREVVSFGDVLSDSDNQSWAWDGKDWKIITPGTSSPLPTATDKGGYHAVVTTAQAAALVRGLVTNTHPVLLPSYMPAAIFDATVNASADDFSIDYQSDLRDKEILFGIMVPNPPPGGANPRDTFVKFRSALPTKSAARGYAEYYVYDPKDAESPRWLLWIEPGTTSNPQLSSPGVPYFLSASGFTDAEFWRVANSLKQAQG
jgi:hypothetical protein